MLKCGSNPPKAGHLRAMKCSKVIMRILSRILQRAPLSRFVIILLAMELVVQLHMCTLLPHTCG